MKTWLRWLLLTLSIGGGFNGLALNLQMFFQPQFQQPVYFFVIAIFTLLYGFVFIAGLLFADDPNRSTLLLIALSLQIPSVSCPLFEYHFSAGIPFVFSIIDGKLNTATRFGGQWQFTLSQKLPWGFGVDLFALFSAIFLLKYRCRNVDSSGSRKTILKTWITERLFSKDK
jgi:hypothetical protein